MSAQQFLQRLYESDLGTSLAESLYVYPLVEGSHLLSLVFSFGLLAIIDLRLVGILFRSVPAYRVLSSLRPWAVGGFVVTFLTGVLLVFATGPKLLATFIFPLKLLLILIAGLNAVWFELGYGRRLSNSETYTLPSGAKVAGWFSLISWSAVIILGRLIPYYDGN